MQNLEKRSSKKTILVVDDDEGIRSSLLELLQEENYRCVPARNGKEALDVLGSLVELPNLILLDLMMPVLDGYEFRAAQELDQRLAKVPVILMSADGQLEAKKMNAGITHHIRKPFDLELLISMIQGLTS